MSNSRSTFYVDIPLSNDLPSQRHSMFVDHSEVDHHLPKQDLSSASSSTTLPSTAGSVDRLTGLGDKKKKTPRFFTLKPKTSFSLRPFFSSTSISSLSPSSSSKRQHKTSTTPRRDSSVQTDGDGRAYDEVGVQTLNASTVDVPVQTCFDEWAEDDRFSYGSRRPFAARAQRPGFARGPSAGYYSNQPSPSVLKSSKAFLEYPTGTKNSVVAPLDSSKVLKYASPYDSAPDAASEKTVAEAKNAGVSEIAKPKVSGAVDERSPTSVPVKYFSAKELTSGTISSEKPPSNVSNVGINTETALQTKPVETKAVQVILKSPPTVQNVTSAKNLESSVATPNSIAISEDISKNSSEGSEVSSAKLIVFSPPTIRPQSALKIERADSPVKHSAKIKTVHFDLSDSDTNESDHKGEFEVSSPKSNEIDFNRIDSDDAVKSRNIDKDFEDLLRNLDILIDDPIKSSDNLSNSDLKISFNSLQETPPKQTIFSSKLKLAFDVLNQDVLPPILETYENTETETQVLTNSNEPITDKIEPETSEYNSKRNLDEPVDDFQENKFLSPTPELNKVDKQKGFEDDSLKSTSLTAFPSSKLDYLVESDVNRENVYDSGIKENVLKTVTLPTLPSFFDSVPKCSKPDLPPVVEKEVSPLTSSVKSKNLLESETEEKMLSRSSSRGSIRSNPKSDFNNFLDTEKKFDSCENLDQLEEEIIRSLCEPDAYNVSGDEDAQRVTSKSPSAKIIDAMQMRRDILDRLLSGESEETVNHNNDINVITPDQIIEVPESKIIARQNKKHVSTLTKFEHHSNEPPLESNFFFQQANSNNSYDKSIPASDSVYGSLPNPALDQNKNSGTSSILMYPVKNEVYSPKTTSVFLFPEHKLLSSGVPEHTSASETMVSVQGKIYNNNLNGTPFKKHTNSIPQEIIGNDIIVPGDIRSETCDFTHCLRPSEIQNSPFIDKISSRSVPFRSSPERSYSRSESPAIVAKSDSGETKVPNTNGQCDFANCLKPSQVQNSVFTAELSEITTNKSSNLGGEFLRTNSPLTARTNSPISKRVSPIMTNKSEDRSKPKYETPNEQMSHKSEMTIVLQTPYGNKIPRSPGDMTQDMEKPENQSEDKTEEPVYSMKKEPELEQVIRSGNTPVQDHSEHTDISASTHTDTQMSSVPINSEVPPPPPPPPPFSSKISIKNINGNGCSLESMIRNQHTNLTKAEPTMEQKNVSSKTPVVLELEKRFETHRRNSCEEHDQEVIDKNKHLKSDPEVRSIPEKRYGSNEENSFVFHASPTVTTYQCNGSNGFYPQQKEYTSPSPLTNGRNENDYNRREQLFSPKTIVTDEPPPPGAVLLDKKITVEGDKVHTDKYYAIPVKEVLKETTTTTKFIPAPPKYEGIGPTEDGVPIAPRNSVKKENMHNWYKTMFKSLHKAELSNDNQEYTIGYSSEPETSRKEKTLRKKSSTLDNRSGSNNSVKTNDNLYRQGYPPSAKSSIDVYNVRPRLIEDYEPGHSSVTDDEITIGYKRYLPSLNTPKPSYEYKNGYEQDNNFIRNLSPSEGPDPEQQKVWYKEIQKGGDVPQFGLGKPAPEKPKDPVIGPLPPPPSNYNGPTILQQATRPLTLPASYQTDNNALCQQSNGPYEVHMRQVIHSELQQRISPSSSQLSSPSRSILKSPSRSPDLKIPARALFDFIAESSKEIPLKKDDMVLILRQLDKNWYEGERQGRIGIFPISYVEIVPPEHASTPTKSFIEGTGKVLYDFTAHTSVELSVRKGDIVSLLRKVDSNWYEARSNNKKGIVPSSYLQVLQEPSEKCSLSPSSKPCLRSPRSSSETKDSYNKANLNSLSPILTNNTSPSSILVGRGKFENRGKKSSSLIEPVMYKAIYSYNPMNSDELELVEGDTIYVVEMCDDGWFVGTSVRTGVFGIFPGNYVEKV